MSSELYLFENENKRTGLAPILYVSCCVCDYSKELYSSTFNKQKVLIFILELYMLCNRVVKVILDC